MSVLLPYRVAYEAADSGLLSPDPAASIRRVKGAKNFGVRLGNWLTANQRKALLGRQGLGTGRAQNHSSFLLRS